MVNLTNISKTYSKNGNIIKVMDNISLSIRRGEWITVLGGSGAGKSTLLFTIAGLLTPDSGRVEVNGTDVYALPMGGRSRFRSTNIGFVFQSFFLFPHLTVRENILMGGAGEMKGENVDVLVAKFGLGHRADHFPSELSVGEKQRCAIARAVFSRAAIVLADEPTGNLDSANTKLVIDDLRRINNEGVTVIFVTHKPPVDIESMSSRIISIENGRIT